MSQITFENLINERPDLEIPLRAIGDWREQNSSLPSIDPRRVARASKVTYEQLARAFVFLCEKGIIQLRFRFESPEGALLGDNYETPDAVPWSYPDYENRMVERHDVVPVFLMPKEEDIWKGVR